MRIYLGMSLLGKKRIGFVLQNEPKNRGVERWEKRRKRGFTHKRTQFARPCRAPDGFEMGVFEAEGGVRLR